MSIHTGLHIWVFQAGADLCAARVPVGADGRAEAAPVVLAAASRQLPPLADPEARSAAALDFVRTAAGQPSPDTVIVGHLREGAAVTKLVGAFVPEFAAMLADGWAAAADRGGVRYAYRGGTAHPDARTSWCADARRAASTSV